ncbi:MAG: L7Ae/L30e/S12e/Gadd45 family ribosomal protein [Oscillospiraceae bacterium]
MPSACKRPGSPGPWSGGALRRPSARIFMRRCRAQIEELSMEKILSMIGLAHEAGRVEIGEEPVGSAARAKKARIILVAGDAAASSVRRAMGFANTGSCLCLVIPASKEELGRALGRTSCAMAAITDMGFADAIAKKLAALDPQRFGSAAERMAVKAQRAGSGSWRSWPTRKMYAWAKASAEAPEEAAPPEKEERREREKKPSRPGKRERGAAARSRQKSQARARFEGSRPVKKGKGSERK